MPSIRSFSPAFDANHPAVKQPLNPAQDVVDELTSGTSEVKS